MVQCPECNQQQDADFGMVTCSHCGAVFMVEIDGSVKESSSPPQEEERPVEAVEDNVNSFSSEEDPTQIQADTAEAESVDSASFDQHYDENFLAPLSDQPVAEEPLSADPVGTINPEDPLGLQDFDQESTSSLPDGEYLYDVSISGIDSGEIKKELLLALSDKRFGLAMEDVRGRIHQGRLVLKQLNPVKAMLIVLKIQEMDVQIEWRQKHFAQETSARDGEVET